MTTGVATQAPAASFLDPAVLARIGNLELLARTVVEGFIQGLHRSPHLGASTDFAEHRAYMPGDDIRRIDWRLWARSDRFYVKEFEADTNTNFRVVIDVSQSMRYGASTEHGRPSKLTYACYLAACLTYFSSLQRDRVGLATIDRDIVDYVPPSAKHLQLVLHALDRTDRGARESAPTKPTTKSVLLAPLRKLSESVRRRSIVVLISDLYEDADDIVAALAHLRGRGNDLVVFQVLDPRELEFPFTDASNFIDMETGQRMPIIPEYLRKQYRELIAQHTASLAKRMGEQRIDYSLFDTSKPLDRALFAYLAARQRFSRVR